MDEVTTSHPLLSHLKAISVEPPSSTILTADGGRLEVHTCVLASSCILLIILLLFLGRLLTIFKLSGAVPLPLNSQSLPCHPSLTSRTPTHHINPML